MTTDVRSTLQKRDETGTVRHGGEWLAIWSDPDSLKSEADKRKARESNEALNHLRASLAAAVRSVSQRRDIEVAFDKRQTDSADRVVLRTLASDMSNIDAARGEADAKAGVLRHHDADIHRALSPADVSTARFFTLLEHQRCAALVALSLPGSGANLVAFHHDELDRKDLLNAHLASLIPLSEGVRMVCRDTFLGAADPSIQTAGFRMWDRWLRERFQPDLMAMRAVLHDQRAFGAAALTFLDHLFDALPSKGERQRLTASTPSDADMPVAGDDSRRRESEEGDTVHEIDPGELLFAEEEETERPSGITTAPPRPYRMFTQAHDKVVRAEELSDAGDLHAARKQLDEKLAEYRQDLARLVARLQRRLMAQQMRRWDFDLDEGLIDGSKLDRIVLNPGFSSAFKQEASSAFRDTVVTLLIDNSGSMRGKSVETACVVADILAAALERCSVATEILGFTTSAWKGGKSASDWARAGRPENPGRLNDLLHIVYKDADRPLRRARDSICAMLSPSLLKENIDGEALQWAAGRLLRRPEERKLLFVISDGAPVDQATLDRNDDKMILDGHLRDTIKWIDENTLIELSAIGIKHDVSSHYRSSVRVDAVTELGDALIHMLDRRLSE